MLDFFFGDGEVVIEEVEKLLLHEVDLGLREEMGVSALDEEGKRTKEDGKVSSTFVRVSVHLPLFQTQKKTHPVLVLRT